MRDQEGAPLAGTEQDYRLPKTVTPQHYEIRLEPDLAACAFKGEESIAVTVHEPAAEIALNALELEIGSVTAERGGAALAGRTGMDAKRERVTLRFDRALEPGQWTLKLAFRGTLNDKLHGFYRSRYQDASGAAHTIAATQFESTDARRAFPCWDEPELKARFRITMVVDGNLTAISNARPERERSLGDSRKEVVFHETIPMSTYLVAFIVGEFEATEPVDAGLPLRVVHVPGKGALTSFAQRLGAFSLKFFADYYGLPCPGDKVDLVAIPDFASGAMENLGAITFRETALLIDENRAARAELERVADVVSHENAHMWFGDLVTMKWWNGIWLNEAFATFMEMLAVDRWKPEWKRWESFSVSRAAAMAVDGLASTRPIEYAVRSPEEARAMFDVLTYEKGAAVLRMLEQFMGAEPFRNGIMSYLRKHQYANAETTDLWDALEESSRAPVREMMDSWIFQPGFPILIVEPAMGGTALKVSQRRFFYRPGAEAEQQLWHVPLMVRAKTGLGVIHHKFLLASESVVLSLGGQLEWAVVNEGGHGFYRTIYRPELLAALAQHLPELSAAERFQFVSDLWAATVAGLAPLDQFLAMARRFTDETDLNVWRALIGAFNYLEMMAGESERPALAAFVRDVVGPAAARLGWEPREGEDELTRQLRATLLSSLGTLGADHEVQTRAHELYARFEKDPAKADRDLVPALIAILAYSGDAACYEDFRKRFKGARTPQEEQRYLFSLAAFRDPALLGRTMAMTLDGQVRTQNAPYLMHSLLLNTACRYQAWDFMRGHWDEMASKYPDSALPRMCEGVTALLDREDEVKNFFAVHRVRIGGKLIDQHLERLAVAIALRRREGRDLAGTLKG